MYFLHIRCILVGACVILLGIGIFFTLARTKDRTQSAEVFYATALRNAGVRNDVSLNGVRYSVIQGAVFEGNATATGAVVLPVLRLAYAHTLARRSPLFGIAGTDPAKLRTSVQALSAAADNLASTATSTKDAAHIRLSLYPILFLSLLADLEEARLRFVSSGSDADAIEYTRLMYTVADAGNVDAAQFSRALTELMGDRRFLMGGVGGTISVESTLTTSKAVLEGMENLRRLIRARDTCLQGNISECDAKMLIFDFPLTSTNDDSTSSVVRSEYQEIRKLIADGGMGIGTPLDPIVALESSRCLGGLEPPYYLQPWGYSGNIISFIFIGELFFVDATDSSGKTLDYLNKNRDISYVLRNPLTFYICPDIQDDAGRARAVIAVASYAHSHHFAQISRTKLLSTPSIVSEKIAREYLHELLREATNMETGMNLNNVNDIENLILMFQDKNGGLDSLVREVADINNTDVHLWRTGIPFDLSARYLFLTHSAFLSFFLAHTNLEPQPYDQFRSIREEDTALYLKQIIPYTQLRHRLSRERILADVRSFFSFELEYDALQ